MNEKIKKIIFSYVNTTCYICYEILNIINIGCPNNHEVCQSCKDGLINRNINILGSVTLILGSVTLNVPLSRDDIKFPYIKLF